MQGSARPFPDDSEEARNARRKRAATDKIWFLQTYLPHYFGKPFGRHHLQALEMLDTRGKSLEAEAVPREHGKSALGSFGYPIHQACTGQRNYMIIVSDTQDLAAEALQWIRLEFEENPRIRQDFGDLVTPGYWTDDDMIIGGKVRLRALGAGQRIRGTRFRQWRPDLIVIDDLENDINVRNKKLVKERFSWILAAVYGSLSRDGTLLMVGTMLARVSVLGLLIEHIAKTAPKFPTAHMRSVVYGAILPDGTPLWPENYTLDELNEIRITVGPVVWASDWMNQPLDEGIIQHSWIKQYAPADASHPMPTFAFVDPSARHGENNDYKAIITIGRDLVTKRLLVLDAWIRRRPIPEMVQAFVDRYVQFHWLLAGCETNGYQTLIKDALEAKCQELGLYPPMRAIDHHTDKVLRVSRLAPLVERGVLLFAPEQGDQGLLIDQLCAIGTSEHDDGPDALEGAVGLAESGGGVFEFHTSGRKRFGLRARAEGYFS